MKKFMFFIAAAVSLAAVGCSKDDAAPEQVQYVSELTLKFEGDTRVSGSHDATKGFSFEWDDGDVIYIYENGTTNSTNYLQYEYDAVSGTFKPDEDVDSDKMEVGKQYFALSSTATANTAVEEGKNVTEMAPSETIENIPLISDVFKANASGTVATMHHLQGMVEIPVKLSASADNFSINEFYLFTDEDTLFCEAFTATPEAPYFKGIAYDYDSYAMSYATNVSLSKESATSIFVLVLPGTFTNVKLQYHYTRPGGVNASGTAELGAGKTLVVERGKITKVSEVEITPKLAGGK
jgi:hypothetical protein